MAAGIYPVDENTPSGRDGDSVLDRNAAEGNAQWGLAVEPLTNVGGTANAITAETLVRQGNLQALTAGLNVILEPLAANTSGTVTLDVDGRGPVAVKTAGGADPAIGALQAGRKHWLHHCGTFWRVLAPPLDFGAGPGVAFTDEPTVDVTAITATGLAGFRVVEGWFVGRVNGAANLAIQARASGGTWRDIVTLAVAAADDVAGVFRIDNFNAATAPKRASGYLTDDIGALTRSTPAGGLFTPTWRERWMTWQEIFDEVRVSVDASSIEGTNANKRAYLRITGQV